MTAAAVASALATMSLIAAGAAPLRPPIEVIAELAMRPAICAAGDGVTVIGGRAASARLYGRMQGFAKVAATSGGLGRRFLEVTRSDDAGDTGTLRWAVDQARRDGGGWIGFAARLPRGIEIALHAPLRATANLTIDGGCIAPLITAPPHGSVVYLQRTDNVVLSRLQLAHQGPAVDGKAGGDCITVSHGTDRVWIAYNDIGHCTDGQVDITQSGVDAPMRATVAHNYFHDHDKAMLISGDRCRDVHTPCDPIALASAVVEGVRVTLDANVFVRTGQRHPRVSGHAFADVAGNVVAYQPQRRVGRGDGGSYGAFASNGGRLLIRHSLYVALEPRRAERAIVAVEPASPGAVRTDGIVALPATSLAPDAAPTLVKDPGYDLGPLPDFTVDADRAAACVADAAGTGGWDRVARATC